MWPLENHQAILMILVAGVPLALVWWEVYSTRRRGKFQFRLRTMFLATAVLCVLLGIARLFKAGLLEIVGLAALYAVGIAAGWILYLVARFTFDEMANLYGRPGRRSPRRRVQQDSIDPPSGETGSASTKRSPSKKKRKRDDSKTRHSGRLPAGSKW